MTGEWGTTGDGVNAECDSVVSTRAIEVEAVSRRLATWAAWALKLGAGSRSASRR
jgi:hypothetical protein